MERELSPLRAIKDAYSKIILARTKHSPYDNEGIRILDLPAWIKSE